MVVRGLADLENQSSNSNNGNNRPMASMQLLPSIKEMLFPGIKLRTFIAAITLIDIAMFIITLIVGQIWFGGAFVESNTSVGPSVDALSAVGGMNTQRIVRNLEIWRYLTPVILHAGLQHIGFNLLFQCSIGFRYEELWGVPRIASIYWVGGLSGTALSALLSGSVVSVGASGALMGLLGAIVAFIGWNWQELPDAPQRLCNVVMLIVINFAVGLSSAGIDNYAHLGGIIGGLLCGTLLLKKYTWTPTQKMIQMGAGGVLFVYFVICFTLTFSK